MFSQNYLKGALASFFMLTSLYGASLDIYSGSKVHHFDVELADTKQKRATGLMNRQHLLKTQGMLFLFPSKEKQCFWMQNTYVSLDILMVNDEGKIVDILPHMEPHSKKVRCSLKPVRRAIELTGGICHDRGIHIGDTVSFARPLNKK